MKTVSTIRALALAAALTLPAMPAHAQQDGVWNTGDGFTVRFANLNLSEPRDRQALLKQFDRVAAQVCAGERIRNRRNLCVKQTTESALANAAPSVKEAVQLALIERDGIRQAMR